MSENTRKQRLQIAKQRLAQTSQRLDRILTLINCDRDALIQWQKDQDKLCPCPIDPRHRVPKSSYNNHYQACLSKSRGVDNLSQGKSPPSSLPFYKHAPAVVSFVEKHESLDKDHQNIVHIQTNQYLESVQARDKAYRDQVQTAQTLRRQHHIQPSDFNVDNLQNILGTPDETQERESRPKSASQTLMENRDYRRRRKVYRVKMSQRTPIEMQRQIVEAYMNEFSLETDSNWLLESINVDYLRMTTLNIPAGNSEG
ncbi:hypothetical protein DFQ29_002335 [Apophysomyces sp. BC1021]|nr:hypothetical protein DFQ29_002335 [Apophysomyces sp. BC1021]